MSFETFKENRFNVSYVLKTAIAYCTQFNSWSHYKKKMFIWSLLRKRSLFNKLLDGPVQRSFLVYLYLNISNTFSIDSETFNVKVHSPWGNDFPYKGPLYIVDLTSVILIHLQKMRYILENILFFSFENLKWRHNLVQEMHLITF